MNRLILRLQIVFLAAFLVVFGIVAYQHFARIGPYKRCEKIGAWYSPLDHTCARVLYVPSITHRYRNDPIPEITARKTVGKQAVAK